jgi:hypothetical protein
LVGAIVPVKRPSQEGGAGSERIADSNSREADEVQVVRPNLTRATIGRYQSDLKIEDSGTAH